METTRMSTKGQVVLPKDIREARAWGPGTRFTIEEIDDGIVLRPAERFPESKLDDVVGCLRFQGKPKTVAGMRTAIASEVARRHGRGRY